ncbi:hypothetical protein BN8_04354 [Fibrisoma limi BUZ 3]|uniref:ABC-2 type transporter transmembrane domain-containing protein n=1 Tax=Fibrisoma limi BUZ 3 TaxID=1185876 RepID=I2GMJ1_9BACT|nr:ABC transporter permease [Fibrisoma limi]CCH55119.1 hypothetical protein BN8_04354 [Fibrisoma limi BUZ 3]
MTATSRILTMYRTQARYEWLKFARMPVYLITLLCVPMLFYLSTGSNQRMPPLTEGISTRLYLLTTLGTFATFGIALFGFGVGSAIERGQGWIRTLRPAPISPWVPVVGKLVVSTTLTAVAVLLLLLEATVVFGVRLPLTTASLLLLTLVGCSIPLSSIGLALGSLIGPNSAPLILVILYLFVSSISGIVVPMQMVARGNPMLADIAPLWPTYHAGQLALSVVRPASFNTILIHIIVLAGYLIGALAIAVWARRRSEAQTFG